MYLGIRTDSPVAELYLYESDTLVAEQSWQADRQLAFGLLTRLEAFLAEHGKTYADITGFFVYQGPGSFTGLRIGLTVMNTFAYAQNVPIVGTVGDLWREEAVTRLVSGENDRMVLPLYGADARITRPRK